MQTLGRLMLHAYVLHRRYMWDIGQKGTGSVAVRWHLWETENGEGGRAEGIRDVELGRVEQLVYRFFITG